MCIEETIYSVIKARDFAPQSKRVFKKSIGEELSIIAEFRPIPSKIRSLLKIKASSFAVGLGLFCEWLPPASGLAEHPRASELSDGHCWFRTDVTIHKRLQFDFVRLDIPSAEKIRMDIWAVGSGVSDSELVESFGESFDVACVRFSRNFLPLESMANVLKAKESKELWGFGALGSPVRRRLVDAFSQRCPGVITESSWLEQVIRKIVP